MPQNSLANRLKNAIQPPDEGPDILANCSSWKMVTMRHVLAACWCSATLLFAAGRSGGGSSSSSSSSLDKIGISGVVSAGPVGGATVTAYALNSDGSKGSQLASGTSDSNGKYAISIRYLNVLASYGFFGWTIPNSGNIQTYISPLSSLTNQATFVGWDFSSVWLMGASGPILQFEKEN